MSIPLRVVLAVGFAREMKEILPSGDACGNEDGGFGGFESASVCKSADAS